MKRLLTALIFILTSCELVVDVDVPNDNANRLVTNAVQNPDSVWTVRLTRSNHILSPIRDNFFPVDYANVVIHNPDGSTETLGLMRTGSGTFKGKSRPQPGLTYKISVDANGLEHVESEMTMPAVVKIENVVFDSTQISPPSSGHTFVSQYLPFTLTFSDPPGQKNFYKVESIVYKRRTYGPPGQEQIDTIGVASNVYIKDAGIATEDDLRESFTDETFEGKTYNAPLAVSFWSFPSEQVIALEIKLESLSMEYFKYEQTASLSFDVMGDPFAQPVPVYSNMSNGFGLFAGGSYDSRKYNVPKQP